MEPKLPCAVRVKNALGKVLAKLCGKEEVGSQRRGLKPKV